MSNILTDLLKETSPSRLLCIVLTDFLALRLFCFNIRQHGRHILYCKLHVDSRKFQYQRPYRLCTFALKHPFCMSCCLSCKLPNTALFKPIHWTTNLPKIKTFTDLRSVLKLVHTNKTSG